MVEPVTVQRCNSGRIFLSLVILAIVLLSTLALVRASPVRSLTSGCDTLTPGTVPFVGQSGTIRFDCNTKAALSATGSATPSFNIAATGYASLAIVLHSSKGCDQAKIIKSGVAVTFGSSRSDYDYCAVFMDPSEVKLGSFKVAWTVGKT